MERSKIPMFDRFDSISHIMPYYALTHKAFLLLSSLSSTTRRKLDEYYSEFVEWMKDRWLVVEINLDEIKKHKLLPLDLFIINFPIITEYNISAFIKFIEIISKSEGWCFNSKYMHSKNKVKRIIVIDTI